MADIVGVRFKRAGRIYYFDPSGIDLEVNDSVVVRTVHGLELGQVVIAPKQVLASELTEPLKAVVRKAEPEDIERVQELAEKEKEVLC
jgi:cell fate regulator YaaT (PSP1 superfamily)